VGPDVARAQGKPGPIGLGPYGTWRLRLSLYIVVQNITEPMRALGCGAFPTRVNFLEIKDMSSAAEQLACVANAEKHLCEQAGPLIARIIEEIENRLDIKIGEVRLTMNASEINTSWGGINCVITQADFGPGADGRKAAEVAHGVQKEAGPC
jgi:hypothetical protein